jgi:geranylgeranyl diphosphate synthase type I
MNQSFWFESELAQAAQKFDEYLAEKMLGFKPVPGLFDPVNWAMGIDDEKGFSKGGKRIRPCLGIMAAQALQIDQKNIFSAALAIEIFHNFTLVHDDIEDGDRIRRNRETVWVKYGTDMAVNAGGYMLSLAFKVISWIEDPFLRSILFKELALVSEKTHMGQALDMSARNQKYFNIFGYYKTVILKTGYCLGFSLVSAGIIYSLENNTNNSNKANNGNNKNINDLFSCENDLVKKLRKISLLSGVLFQIIDDIIDLSPAKGRETAGSDIKEGKRSCLASIAMAQTGPDSKTGQELLSILNTPRNETNQEMITRAVDIFKNSGALEKSFLIVDQIRIKLKNHIQGLPENLARLILSFTDYQCSRLV